MTSQVAQRARPYKEGYLGVKGLTHYSLDSDLSSECIALSNLSTTGPRYFNTRASVVTDARLANLKFSVRIEFHGCR